MVVEHQRFLEESLVGMGIGLSVPQQFFLHQHLLSSMTGRFGEILDRKEVHNFLEPSAGP